MLRYIKTGIRTVIIQPPRRAFDKVKEYQENSRATRYRFPRATRVKLEKIRRRTLRGERIAARRRWIMLGLALITGIILIYFLYKWTFVYFHL